MVLLLASCAHGSTPEEDDDGPPDAAIARADAATPPEADAAAPADAAPPADAAEPIDAAESADADLPDPPDAHLPPDAAVPHPDAMVPHPDAAVPHPDAAVPPPDAGSGPVTMFANDESSLYRIDPTSYASVRVAGFAFPGSVGSDAMADLAIGPDGTLYGISSAHFYKINPTTAACTLLGNPTATLNALGYVPAGVIDAGAETLVGAAVDGSLYKVNPTNGALTLLGHFSSGHASSGDVAYVSGPGLVASINPGGTDDALAKVNPSTGATTSLGSTHVPWVWGLGNAGGTLVGFTLGGTIVTINPANGAATTVATGTPLFRGAAAR